jgi:hypothetical protein
MTNKKTKDRLINSLQNAWACQMLSKTKPGSKITEMYMDWYMTNLTAFTQMRNEAINRQLTKIIEMLYIECYSWIGTERHFMITNIELIIAEIELKLTGSSEIGNKVYFKQTGKLTLPNGRTIQYGSLARYKTNPKKPI